MLHREWRCSWSSADRRCSNCIWVINYFIAYLCASYIRGYMLTVRNCREHCHGERWINHLINTVITQHFLCGGRWFTIDCRGEGMCLWCVVDEKRWIGAICPMRNHTILVFTRLPEWVSFNEIVYLITRQINTLPNFIEAARHILLQYFSWIMINRHRRSDQQHFLSTHYM